MSDLTITEAEQIIEDSLAEIPDGSILPVATASVIETPLSFTYVPVGEATKQTISESFKSSAEIKELSSSSSKQVSTDTQVQLAKESSTTKTGGYTTNKKYSRPSLKFSLEIPISIQTR